LTLGLLSLVVGLPGAAQDDAPERRLDLEEICSLRDRSTENAALGAELRTRIVKEYDEAIRTLEAAAVNRAEAVDSERQRAGVARQVEALRAELSRPEPQPHLPLPDDATTEQAEGALARERSRLEATRSALREIERLVEERSASRNEISRRLGALDQQRDALADQLTDAAQDDLHPDLSRAIRNNLLARREAIVAEAGALRAQLALLNARSVLIPWRIDKSRRRVVHSEAMVALLEEATRDLRRKDAQDSLRRVRELCANVTAQAPTLNQVAGETELLAEMLWSTDGIGVLLEEASKKLPEVRRYRSDLDRIVTQTHRKFEAMGYRGSLGRWWPQIPEDFPRPGDIGDRIRALNRKIPEAQHQVIRFEEQRSASRELERQILDQLNEEFGESITPELELRARELLAKRRELLDRLIQQYNRYSNQLVELEPLARDFLQESEGLQRFLFERLLWSRSVPRPVIPRLSDLTGAAGWLLSPQNWKDALATILTSVPPARGTALGLVFVALLVARPWVRRRMTALARGREDGSADTIGATLETLVHTVVLAVPLPFVLYLVSTALLRAETSLFSFSAARALYYVASIAALIGLTRQLLARDGLAEAHFGWPSRITRPIHDWLFWRGTVFLVLIYVALHLAMAGTRLTSPAELQLYNNSLGRVAFVVAMVALGSPLLNLLRSGRSKGAAAPDLGPNWTPRRTALASLVTATATLVPAILAGFGYYITALLLAYQMLQTFWLGLGLLATGGLLFRWRATRQTAVRETASVVEHVGGTAQETEAQVRKVIRLAVVLVAAVSLYTVWSPAFPALALMKRVQIWPQIALLESQGTTDPAPSTIELDQSRPAEGGPDTDSAAPALVGLPPASTDAESDRAPEPLTLWKLLESVLAGFITWVLVMNVPGVVETLLSRRRGMDSGARVALATLVRYAIMIFGVTVTLSLLGISWSKVQWLAAALTFGLGFGLQEIVANFVSGLILLLERPARINDAVTIGNLQGRVTRIRIRATTITLWDHSEMIVPNREFITQKLVNWTLSDAKRRIEIPVRVAYGSDLEKVKEAMLKVAHEHPKVHKDPVPQALLLQFGDDAIRFELRCFVDFGEGLETKDDLHMALDRSFRDRGIEFALPRLDIRVPGRGGGRGLLREPPPPRESDD
jgi:potassium efflux system protein